MANGRYESVSTFALPDPYQQQAAEARRRRRMAEMLAQQAYQPGDIQNAPIPAAAPFVQGLQAFLTARAGRKADEAEESAREAASREARQLVRALTEEGDTTTNAVQPAMTPMAKTVTAPQFEDGRITAPASIEMVAPPPMIAPETQLSRYNLTPGQRRAAALEGMLTSENPMLQKVAGAIYPTLAPKTPETKTMEFGGRLLNVTGGQATPVTIDGVAVTEPTKQKARTASEDFGGFIRTYYSDGSYTDERKTLAPTDPPASPGPLEYVIGKDGKPELVTRANAVGRQRAPQPTTPRTGPTGDSSTDRRDYRKSKRELQNAYNVVNDFLQALKTTPKEESLVGEKAGELSSKYKLALGAIRTLQNTGVLQPSELPFIEDTLRDPQKISQLFNPSSRETIFGQINAISDSLESQSTTLDESYGYDAAPLRGSETRRANRVPAAAAAAGITQEEWDNSTAEERKPWL
jgi:hypothetical protein